MKKLLIFILCFILLVLFGWYAYITIFPRMAAKAIISGDYQVITPKKIDSKLDNIRDSINSDVEEIIQMTDTLGISFDQLINGIDDISKREILNLYDLIKSSDSTDPEAIFDMAYSTIKIDSFDPIILKEPFLENINQNQIKKILNYIETHKLIENVGINMSKEIAKRIIIEKKEEIFKRTQIIKGDTIRE